MAAKSRRRKRGGAAKNTAFFRVCGGGIFIPSVPSRKARFIPEGGSVKIPPPPFPCLHGHSVTAVTPIPQFYSPPQHTHKKERNCFTGFPLMNTFFRGGRGNKLPVNIAATPTPMFDGKGESILSRFSLSATFVRDRGKDRKSDKWIQSSQKSRACAASACAGFNTPPPLPSPSTNP